MCFSVRLILLKLNTLNNKQFCGLNDTISRFIVYSLGIRASYQLKYERYKKIAWWLNKIFDI